MSIIIGKDRGEGVANLLYHAFSTTGIHGRKDMPEDLIPEGVLRGSLEHLLFITLTVSIDYQRDAISLWRNSRKTYEDPETRYLFSPQLLYEAPLDKIIKDMQKYGLSKKKEKDAHIWRRVGISFFEKWGGDPRNFLEDCNWDAIQILKRLKGDSHESGGKAEWDFPFLRGNKIGPLWLRMLRDNLNLSQLRNLDQVPIPVDRHVARATLTTGVVRGQFRGRLEELFEDIRKAWSESVKGLRIKDREMIALDVDEPLWHLSKYGCKSREKTPEDCTQFQNCVAREFCMKGQIKIAKNMVELNT